MKPTPCGNNLYGFNGVQIREIAHIVQQADECELKDSIIDSQARKLEAQKIAITNKDSAIVAFKTSQEKDSLAHAKKDVVIKEKTEFIDRQNETLKAARRKKNIATIIGVLGTIVGILI